MAIEYAPLFALETQFQTKDGRNNTGGWLKVFLAATDDPAVTYSDYNYTRNPEKIILDDDGRALVICDKSKAYRLEVYDMNGMLLWTEEPVYCSGTGGGGVSITRVISTDGSIAVSESTAGSTTTYDIGMAPSDSVEFLEWGAAMRGNMHEGGIKPATLNSGTMEMGTRGPKLLKDHYYHITNWMTVIPSGSGRNYETLTVTLHVTDGTGWHSILIRDFDIDTSVSDSVTHEFSLDFLATEDCEIFWELSDNVPDIGVVDYLGMNVHRIYSGINAVPGTCATKQWVSESYQPLSGMSSYVPYSAVDHNTVGQVTGINGSAIAGSIDSATVSSIASSVASAYTESAFSSISSWTADLSSISSKADQSALTAYQPVSAMSGYATEAYVDAAVGDKLDATASSLFLTSLPDDLATTGDVASAVSGKLDKSASGEFYPMTGNPSGFLTAHQSLAGYATEQYVDSAVSSKLDTSAFASASGNFQPTGDYAYNSSLSAYIPTSASGAFAPSGDYAFNSSLSSKMDVTASSLFVQNSAYTAYTANMGDVVNNISSSITSMSSDVTGKQDASAMTAWIPYSALDYSGTAISGIGGSSLAGMGGGADYSGIYPVSVNNEERTVAVDSLPLVTDSSMTSYASGGSSVIGVNLDIMSGKLDSSAQVVTATATQLYAGTAFLTGVNGAPVSASRAGNAANASMANSAYYDGTGRLISSLPDSATVSAIASAYTTGKQDTLTFSYDDDKISAINGSALAGQGGATGDYYEKSSTELAYGTGATSTRSSFSIGSASADYFSIGIGGDAFGKSIATLCSISLGSNSAKNYSVALGRRASATGYSIAVGDTAVATQTAFAFSYATADNLSFAMGLNASAKNTAMVFGKNNLIGDGDVSTGNSAAFIIGDGTAANARHDLMRVTKDGEITMFSSTTDTVGTGIMSSIRTISGVADTVSANSASWGQGGPVTATASAAASAYTSTGSSVSSFTGISSVNGSALLARTLLPNTQQASGAAHFHYMPSATPWGATEYTGVLSPLQYATGAALAMKHTNNYGAYYKGNEWFISDVGTNTAANGVVRAELHRTRGIHLYGSSLNSATGFHLNGSGVDGKSGASAWQYGPTEYNMLTSVNNTVSANSASWGVSGISSATCSAIASAYAESAASGKADQFSAGVGLEFVQSGSDQVLQVEAPVDIVGGPGIVIDNPDGNTLRVSADENYETVLYSSDTAVDQGGTMALSENPENFSTIKLYVAHAANATNLAIVMEYTGETTRYDVVMPVTDNATNLIMDRYYFSRSGTTVTVGARKRHTIGASSVSSSDLTNPAFVMKIVGVHRIAGGN